MVFTSASANLLACYIKTLTLTEIIQLVQNLVEEKTIIIHLSAVLISCYAHFNAK